MKKLLLICVLLIAGCATKQQPYDLSDVGAGGEGLSTWTELTTTPAADDWAALTDKSDTTGSDDGTSKKVSYQTFVNPRVVNKSTGTTLTADEVGGTVYVSAAVTSTLPDVSTVEDGTTVCFYSTGANTIIIDVYASDRIRLDGTALTDGYTIENTSAAAGDFICLQKDSSAGWTTWGYAGTWADGGAT